MRVYLEALGCKLNQSEMETLARRFRAVGHRIASRAEEADICVLNTCTVTHMAARKSRQALRRLRRSNPHALLIATGCYAEMSPAEIEALGCTDLIFGNADKASILALLAAQMPDLVPASRAGQGLPVPKPGRLPREVSRTRALVKIQDGCDNACTYCTVRIARGPSVSKPRQEIVEEIRRRVEEGYQEVILTGVHIGCYGRDRGDSLPGLVGAILSETDIARLRLSSIEPWDFSADLLELWHDPRLCRHLHLPLQSGCDATLQRMGRRYTAAQYAASLSQARDAVPDLAVTTDIIAGFPLETDAEFAASLAFARRQGFARLHVFKYSRRPGTAAATMPGQVPYADKKARSSAMRRMGEEAAQRFRERFLGRTLAVLWESQVASGSPGGLPTWSGLTDNYIRVYTRSASQLANVIAPAKLIALHGHGVWAESQGAGVAAHPA